MKVLIDIPDNKVAFGIEVLKSLTFVKKAETISGEKATLIKEIKQAVKELNLVKVGKLKARNVEDLIKEL